MPGREAYSYALWRVVPYVERGECLNVGVVVFSRRLRFLGARTEVDEGRLSSLAPGLDPAMVRSALHLRVAVADGDPAAGAVAALEPSERFGWLVAPSSTIIQPGPVHTGLCDDGPATLDHLFATLVAAPGAG